MLACWVRLLLWGVVLGFCLGAQGWPGRTRGPGCLQKRQSGSKPGSRIPQKYCIPTGNSSSSGNIIQVCGSGQYREWQGPSKGLCVPCSCNGLSHQCDPFTGRCLNCQYNTAGDRCQHCAEGYYGQAAERSCKLCPCPFSVMSNSFALGCAQVGPDVVECVCKPGYAGLRCERCSSGYYGNPLLPYGRCQPCNCNHGKKCHPLTGECENPDGTDDCQECGACEVSLLKDLEEMEDELSRLKSQLQKLSGSGGGPQAQIHRLEKAIAATRELVSRFSTSVASLKPRVKQLETDLRTIDEDLVALDNKATKLFPKSEEVLKDVTHTKHRSHELLNRAEDLFNNIQDLLDQISGINHTDHTSGPVAEGDAVRMLREAERLVQQMRRQNCTGQRTAALSELQQAHSLLDYITWNLTDPSSTNQALVDRIAGSLMRDLAGLRDLQKALKLAEHLLRQTHNLNSQSQTTFGKLQSRAAELSEERESITADLQMASELLGNVSDLLGMLQDSKTEYELLAAQLDGAKNNLAQKLSSLSTLASVAEVVHQAEIHAQNLSNLAKAFSTELQTVVSGSDVQRFVEVIRAYADIIKAVEDAAASAGEARTAADRALEDVTKQDLTSMARRLIEAANIILSKAKKAETNLNDTAAVLGSQQQRASQATDKMAALWRDLWTSQQNLRRINRDDTEALLMFTKAAVSSAQARVDAVTTRLQEISTGLRNISVPSAGGPDLDEVLNQTNYALLALNQTFPELVDTIADVENISALAPPNGNMSESMRRIRELIQQTRQMANAIKVPMMFTGKGYVELRPPADLRDLRAVTTFDLHLQRPPLEPPRGDLKRKRRRRQGREKTNDMFVLYLGNKNASEDFVGMVLRNNILYGIYRLGREVHQMKLSNVTRSPRDPAYFDRVDFYRVYQDMEVIYTRAYTSKSPVTLSFLSYSESPYTLLDLDPDQTVFYVGGYPQDFTPPAEMGLGLSLYHGCIESSTLNQRLLGLYNFRRAVNVNLRRPCVRQVLQDKTEELYFDGTGYATVNITKIKPTIKQIQFSVKSVLKNAMLFYIGNEKSYYSLVVEKGYLVLTGGQRAQVHSNRTRKEVFPTTTTNFRDIRIIFINEFVKLFGETQISIPYTKDKYKYLYIGGLPASLRERDGITAPPLKGSLQSRPKVNTLRETFIEMLGVMKSSRENLLAVRKADFKAGSSLTQMPKPFSSISLGFQTTHPGCVLLQTTQNTQGVELSLTNGHVEFKYGNQTVRSDGKYHNGRWHYLTAFRNDSGLRLTIDDSDTGSNQSPGKSQVVTNGNSLSLGGEIFTGCLGDLYIKSLSFFTSTDPSVKGLAHPSNLFQFTQKGDVSLGVCNAEHPPQAIRSAALKQRHKKKHSKKESGSGPDACRSPGALPHAFSMMSPVSQLSYHIPPEELNYRPHFSLVMKTVSTDGLILHIRGKHRGAEHVALYVISGKIKLAVGDRSIHYHKRINDDQWHKVDFSVEKNTFHLLVDGWRVTDGQLPEGKGARLNLSSPVYLGADLTAPNRGAQRKSLPRDSVTGCIYNFKFYNELVGEALTKVGVLPCYDGAMESGVFFSGEGGYLASKMSLMVDVDFHLSFYIHPGDLQGLLFYARGRHQQSISVYLQNDKVIAQADDGGGNYSVSIAVPRNLCDSFHSVAVHKQKNSIKLELGFKSRHVRGPSTYSWTILESFWGGMPGDLQDNHVPLWQSYVGCLREVKLNGEDISLGSLYMPHGPVSLQGCPVN